MRRNGGSVLRAVAAGAALVVVAAVVGLSVGHATRPGRAPDAARITPLTASVTRPARTGTLFVPVAPCVILDTRAAGGPIPAGGNRSFHIRGTTGFPAQGGPNGGCGVPASAASVSYQLQETSPQGTGLSRVYPYGGTVPPTRTLTYTNTGFSAIGSVVALPAPGTTFDITIDAIGSSAQAVVTVTGFSEPQIAATISLNGTIVSGTSRVTAASRTTTGQYTVTVDRDLTGCTPLAGTPNPYYASAHVNGMEVLVTTYDKTATPIDTFWSLVVDC